jgi:hypothetical protein
LSTFCSVVLLLPIIPLKLLLFGEESSSFAVWKWNGQSKHSFAGSRLRQSLNRYLFGACFRSPFGSEPLIRVLCSSLRHGKIAERMARKIIRGWLTGAGGRIFWCDTRTYGCTVPYLRPFYACNISNLYWFLSKNLSIARTCLVCYHILPSTHL